MTALARDRQTPERKGFRLNKGVAASTRIWQGSMVAIDGDGYIVPADADNTLRVLGCAMQNVDNTTGLAAAKTCEIGVDCYRWGNSGGADEIEDSDIGSLCYAVDDQTVALTSDTGDRPVAGRIWDVDADGVWVDHDWAEQSATVGNDTVDSQHIVDGAIDLVHMAAESIDSDQFVDGSIDAAHIASAAVTPVKLLSGYRTVAEDAALTLGPTDRTINLLSCTTGTHAATMTGTQAGHRVTVKLTARSGGAYTLAASSQTVTLDAAGEGVELVYDGSAWQWVALLGGATAA
jgi:hypothetical protein